MFKKKKTTWTPPQRTQDHLAILHTQAQLAQRMFFEAVQQAHRSLNIPEDTNVTFDTDKLVFVETEQSSDE